MGFMRKLIIIGTGGVAPIKAESYGERTAKAVEKQAQIQQKMLRPTWKGGEVSSVGSRREPADEIERLAKLHAKGSLTDEEFAAAKAKILDIEP